jgi:hypothetical protein
MSCAEEKKNMMRRRTILHFRGMDAVNASQKPIFSPIFSFWNPSQFLREFTPKEVTKNDLKYTKGGTNLGHVFMIAHRESRATLNAATLQAYFPSTRTPQHYSTPFQMQERNLWAKGGSNLHL